MQKERRRRAGQWHCTLPDLQDVLPIMRVSRAGRGMAEDVIIGCVAQGWWFGVCFWRKKKMRKRRRIIGDLRWGMDGIEGWRNNDGGVDGYYWGQDSNGAWE